MLNIEKDLNMREKEILARAFAMPLTSPAYPPDRTGSSTGNT